MTVDGTRAAQLTYGRRVVGLLAYWAQAARFARTTSGAPTGSIRNLNLLAWLAFCIAPLIVYGQTSDPDPIRLSDGDAVVARLRPGERANYFFEAENDGTYLIEVDQRGLDFIVTLESPDTSEQSYNSPLSRDEREFVLAERVSAGRYQISIHSDEYTGAIGEYTIEVTRLSASSPRDEQAIAAWALITHAARANFEATENSWTRAVAAYEAAAAIWRQVGRAKEEAYAVFSLATIEYWQLTDWKRSASLAGTAAERYREAGEHLLSASAMHLRAAALIEEANEIEHSSSQALPGAAGDLFAEALELFEKARSANEAAGEVYDVGLIINNIGLTRYYMGDLQRARESWREATRIFRSLEEWTAELNPLGNQAVIDAEEGNLINAIEVLSRIIEILPSDRSLAYRAAVLDNLASSHRLFGNLDEALALFSAALALHIEIDDRQGEAQSRRGIGATYFSFGYLDLAREFLLEALPMLQDTNDGRGRRAAATYLADIEYLQVIDSALRRHRDALGLAASSLDKAYLRLAVARDLLALDRPSDALNEAHDVHRIATTSRVRRLEAQALQQLGRAQSNLGEISAAIDSLNQALDIYVGLGLEAEQAETLHGLAMAYRARGDLKTAAVYGESSLAKLEAIRNRVADPELRAFQYAMRREFFGHQVAVLMDLAASSGSESNNYVQAALSTSERSRGRLIVDLINEASNGVREIDAALARRQTDLYTQLADYRYQRDRILNSDSLSIAQEARLTTIVERMTSLENELKVVETDIRRKYPNFANLNKPKTLDAAEIQASLDSDTALLQYTLGSPRSFVWVVTQDSIAAFPLPGEHEIEAVARNVLLLLQKPRLSAVEWRTLETALQRLAEVILTPLEQRIDSYRLLVAADGVMQYVPFGLLPIVSGGQQKRLLDEHEIVAVPSISAVVAQRARANEKQNTQTLIAFADPVFSSTDPRLAAVMPGQYAPRQQESVPPRSSALRGADSLERLPYSAREVEQIAALVSEDERTLVVGLEATRQTVLETDLSDYRIVHFATHGSIDARYPGLSALELSRYNRDGVPQEGALRLHDIYDLKLGADLVVLSACETALGREIGGEGLFGLTHAFMYAGAKSMVASLWQVSDLATTELMTRFYDGMLNEGLRPAAALRAAQIGLAAERRWGDPYFWSGFVLLGDWR
jgi:CHAT domain-containing protein